MNKKELKLLRGLAAEMIRQAPKIYTNSKFAQQLCYNKHGRWVKEKSREEKLTPKDFESNVVVVDDAQPETMRPFMISKAFNARRNLERKLEDVYKGLKQQFPKMQVAEALQTACGIVHAETIKFLGVKSESLHIPSGQSKSKSNG